MIWSWVGGWGVCQTLTYGYGFAMDLVRPTGIVAYDLDRKEHVHRSWFEWLSIVQYLQALHKKKRKKNRTNINNCSAKVQTKPFQWFKKNQCVSDHVNVYTSHSLQKQKNAIHKFHELNMLLNKMHSLQNRTCCLILYTVYINRSWCWMITDIHIFHKHNMMLTAIWLDAKKVAMLRGVS